MKTSSYESSMTHRVEVPRMLLAQHGDLEDYISKVRDLSVYFILTPVSDNGGRYFVIDHFITFISSETI